MSDLIPSSVVGDGGHGVENFGHDSPVPLSLLSLLLLDIVHADRYSILSPLKTASTGENSIWSPPKRVSTGANFI